MRNRLRSPLALMFAALADRRRPGTAVLPSSRHARPRVPRYAYGSASEARLAVCSRMSTPCLRRRVERLVWSAASLKAADRVLQERRATVVVHSPLQSLGDLCHDC